MAGQYRFKDSNGNIVAQISASVGGAIAFSGSVVDFTQANNVILGNVQLAGTASNALLLDGFDSQAFAFTSSIHPFTASIAGTNTFTSSATARLNSIETISASNISRINSLETTSASNLARLNSIETITSSNVARLNSLEAKTGSLASTGSNTFIGTQTITGSLYISSDLIVQGSSSLQNITASAVSIGTNIINLNTANPAIRYAGLSIGDSGSIGSSGSFLYDSVQDEMIFVHRGANSTVTSSVVLMGPQTYDSIGSESYLTNDRITKGTGNEHLVDSNITDNGTLVTINSVTSSFSGLVGIGTTTPTSKLDIYGTSGNANPIFKVIGTSAADSFNYVGTMLNPSLGSGRNYALFIGKALNTKDSAYIGFNHSGTDGSDSNFVNIGHFNNDYMLNIRGNGFVGIGVTNPSQILSVSGSVSLGNLSAALNFTGGGNARFLEIGSSGDALLVTHASGFGVGYFGYQSADDRLVVACDNGAGNNKIDFIVNATSTTGGGTNNLSGVSPAMRIQANGNISIGLGGGGAGSKLTIYEGDIRLYKNHLIDNAPTWLSNINFTDEVDRLGARITGERTAWDGAPMGLGFDTGGVGTVTRRMTITTGGNVGIGTTNPGSRLTISRATEAQAYQLQLRVIGGISDANYDGITFTQGAAGATPLGSIRMKYASSGYPSFGIYTRSDSAGEAERLSISNAGYVTKPFQPAFKAGRSSNISVGANSTIVFNDTDGIHFNIGGHYSTSTGLFTAPVAGRYIFSAVVIYQSLSNGQAMDDAFYIYRNSSLVAYSFRRAEYEAGYTGNGAYYVDHANTLLNLAAGDTVSIRNNRALDVHGNTAYTYFYGYMLG